MGEKEKEGEKGRETQPQKTREVGFDRPYGFGSQRFPKSRSRGDGLSDLIDRYMLSYNMPKAVSVF